MPSLTIARIARHIREYRCATLSVLAAAPSAREHRGRISFADVAVELQAGVLFNCGVHRRRCVSAFRYCV
jgi:hypothetical protein